MGQEARVEGVLGREETGQFNVGLCLGYRVCRGALGFVFRGQQWERLVRVMEPWRGSLDPQAELALFNPAGQGGAGRLLTRDSFNGIYLAAACKLGRSAENWKQGHMF